MANNKQKTYLVKPTSILYQRVVTHHSTSAARTLQPSFIPVLMDDVSLQHPRIQPAIFSYIMPTSLTRNQPRWISPAPKPHKVKQEFISRFFLLSTISGCFYPQRFPCFCFQDPLSFPQPVSDLTFPYKVDPVQAVKRDFVNTLLIFWPTTGGYNNKYNFYPFTS